MIDIDKEFRSVFPLVTSSKVASESDDILTLEKLREVAKRMREIDPPTSIRTSKHVAALGSIQPASRPITDDMRKMCEDIGPQDIPVAYVLDTPLGRIAVTNPVNMKNKEGNR